MAKLSPWAISSLAVIGVVSISIAQQNVVPYAGGADEPYAITAHVIATEADGGCTAQVTVTQKTTNAVVFNPRVHFGPGMSTRHAEIFSDPVDGRPQFDVDIDIDVHGAANVRFKAFDHLVQASSAKAILDAGDSPSK